MKTSMNSALVFSRERGEMISFLKQSFHLRMGIGLKVKISSPSSPFPRRYDMYGGCKIDPIDFSVRG